MIILKNNNDNNSNNDNNNNNNNDDDDNNDDLRELFCDRNPGDARVKCRVCAEVCVVGYGRQISPNFGVVEILVIRYGILSAGTLQNWRQCIGIYPQKNHI